MKLQEDAGVGAALVELSGDVQAARPVAHGGRQAKPITAKRAKGAQQAIALGRGWKKASMAR